MQVLAIAQKDIYQFLKKWQTFVFLLLMPVIFILIFGNAFGGSSAVIEKPILLVSAPNSGVISGLLLNSLETSNGLTIQRVTMAADSLEQTVADSQAAGGLILPEGLDETLLAGSDYSGIQWSSGSDLVQASLAKGEVDRLIKQVHTAVELSRAMGTSEAGLTAFQANVNRLAGEMQTEPVRLETVETAFNPNPYSHAAPGMMLQFAVAGLTGVAAILVFEKNGRTEARMRMTGVPAWQVLLGHFTAIVWLLGMQFLLLLIFGQWVLGLDYLATLPATLLLSILTILCISALGLLIGVVSKSEEETVVYAMLCMFVLSGLGGLWMPLDVTGKAFQTLGYLTPLAWAMDGYKAILVSGAGLTGIANSLLVLGAYTLGLLGITIGVYANQKAKAR